MTRRGWWGGLLLVAVLAGLYGTLAGAKVLAVFLPDSDQNGEFAQFPTREPCTPVADDLNAPLYPDAAQVTVLPAATPQWLGVIKTISFQTPASPEQVVAFYKERMTHDGWSADYQLTEVMKTPTPVSPPTIAESGSPPVDTLTTVPGILGPNPYVTDPTIIETLGFAAFCGTVSAHPPRVYVVIHAPTGGLTHVELQIH
jgi:hypothetical protein